MNRRGRLRSKMISLIDSAGSARRLAAAYRQDARAYPAQANIDLANSDRKKQDARWYLRLARDTRFELTGAA